MTSLRWSLLFRGVAAAALVVLAGYGAAAANAATSPPGTIRSGTSLSDSGIARDVDLRARDFPRGWLSTPGPSSLGHSPCPGVNGAQTAVSASAISPAFTSRNVNTAESTAYVYTDAGEATHWFGR